MYRELCRKSLVQLVIVVYLCTFMEWLFLFTKPSFLNVYGILESFGFFLIAGLWLAFFASVAQTAVICVGLVIEKILPNAKQLSFCSFLPGSVAAILTILLVDNFTYTVFRKGIINAEGLQSYLLALAFILLILFFKRIFQDKLKTSDYRVCNYGVAALVSVSILLFSGRYLLAEKPEEYKLSEGRRSNIFFFAADGIEAGRMSAYGAKRKTTPRLDQLLADSLIAENTISNAGRTTGSVTSMLTGKFPTTTKVFFPPHAFSGKDTLEHLPFILKEFGYKGIEETIRYYADSSDLNLQSGYDVANGREIKQRQNYLPLKFLKTFSPDLLLQQRIPTPRIIIKVKNNKIKKIVVRKDV